MAVLKNKFSKATNFHLGRAYVNQEEKIYCIDRNGSILYECKTDDFQYFSAYPDNELNVIREAIENKTNNTDLNLLDFLKEKYDFKTGMELDNIKFATNNYVFVTKNNKDGVLDIKGNLIIPFDYDTIFWSWEYDLLEARLGGKCGFINMKNEIVIPFEYDNVGINGFSYGLCQVEKDNKIGYIDRRNNVIIPIQYELGSEEFFDSLACVKISDCGYSYYKYISADGKDAF